MGDINNLNMDSDLLVYGCEQEEIEQLADALLRDQYQEEMRVIIIDPGYRLLAYPQSSNLLCPPLRDEREIERALEQLQMTIHQRLDLLASKREKYLHRFNECYPEERLPFITVIVTEVKDLDVSKNSLLQSILLNDDNAGVYFLALTAYSVEELGLGMDSLMFNAKSFQETLSLFATAMID